MATHLTEADHVLMVCTETYRKRVDGEEDPGVGRGVCWEANLIYNDLYQRAISSTKYIPVLFDAAQRHLVPLVLQGHSCYPVDTDAGYEDLCRHLTDQPPVTPGTLGPRRVMLPGTDAHSAADASTEFVKKTLSSLADMAEPIRSLLKLSDQIAQETALRAYDAAETELPSWPSRDGARDFFDCARVLLKHEPVEFADSHYHPLGVYLEDVARKVERSGATEDVETAERLRQIVMSGPYEPCSVRGRSVPNSALAPEQALVLRIVRDVEGIEETPGSGDRLRVLPYQLNYECEPCPNPCSDDAGRCACVAKNARLHFLGAYALETSTARLKGDLQGRISEWFAKSAGGLPARVQFFVSRAHAFQVLNEGLDLMSVRLDCGVEDGLSAWAVASYHIDERLSDETELGQLKARLESRAATINIVNPADSLRKLVDEASDRDAVIMGEERPAYVVDCLRRFPRALKTEIAAGNPDASHIAAIVDLPEYGCNFDTADQEPIQNENL